MGVLSLPLIPASVQTNDRMLHINIYDGMAQISLHTQIAKFMVQQMGPMMAPRTLLSEYINHKKHSLGEWPPIIWEMLGYLLVETLTWRKE